MKKCLYVSIGLFILALILSTHSVADVIFLEEGTYYDTETEEVFLPDQRGGMKSYETERQLRPTGYYNEYRDMETQEEIEVLPSYENNDDYYPGYSLDESYHDGIEDYGYDD